MTPRAPWQEINQGRGPADRPNHGQAWRCCCCPAHGRSTQPEHSLRDHWARDCPGRAGREERGDA